MADIEILSGPIRSGKTTNLMKWVSSKKNIDGILQPIIEDKRFIYSIGTKTLKQLEFDEDIKPQDIIEVGKYKFNKATLEWARNILSQSLINNPEYLVIDEVGKLEMDGLGLEPVISEVLTNSNKFSGKIIIVVRESLLEKFLVKYNLKESFQQFNFE